MTTVLYLVRNCNVAHHRKAYYCKWCTLTKTKLAYAVISCDAHNKSLRQRARGHYKKLKKLTEAKKLVN